MKQLLRKAQFPWIGGPACLLMLLKTTLLLIWGFRLWVIDLRLPHLLHGDAAVVYFQIKSIIQGGWFQSSEFVGAPASFSFLDYPITTSTFQFLIVKSLTLFTDNPFLVANMFYLLSFFLIAIASYYALTSPTISRTPAVVLSILYAFLPYHLYRGSGYLWLGNYFIVALVIAVCVWLLSRDFYANGAGSILRGWCACWPVAWAFTTPHFPFCSCSLR